MIAGVMEWCAQHRIRVVVFVGALSVWAFFCLRQTPLDAIPDLSDPQVIVFTEWMGRGPDLVEDQITYPLVRALQSTPGVRTVRGYSMFGMSFVYVIFDDATDVYWARSRVQEQLARVARQMPEGAAPTLGPDATGIGWVYEYVLEDTSGRRDLAQLRELQDFTVRPFLQAVPGVSEVASVGGFERQYQVVVDSHRLAAYDLALSDVTRAIRDSNSEVGARVVEMAGREYVLRGRGYVRTLADLERSVVSVGPGGTPVLLRDIASVRFGPEIRRGAVDWNGRGEAVGGIVVMRLGANARDVVRAVRARLAELRLPRGVRLRAAYDRSELIDGAIGTLRTTLLEEALIVALVCLVFLFHVRSALVAIVILPLSLLLAFIPMRYLGLSSNIMSLGGIAIAIGELSDAAIVLIENAHVRLADAPPGADRKRVVIDAAKEVGPPIFFSLLLITVSFLPIFTLAGQAGRLFRPLAYTKTFAMFAAALLSVTLAPPLMVWLIRGKIRGEDRNPVSRGLRALYRPIVRLVVRRSGWVIALAIVALGATVPAFRRLGSEFMPPLNEGTLLVMPTTFPGISIEQARRAMVTQDRILVSFPEVATVFGKVGRAETATDPAQIDMIETVIQLRPRAQWPQRDTPRWYSSWAPRWLRPALRWLWPDRRPRSLEELQRDLAHAIEMPGYQMAVSPPIRTRIDMLTTGVRTPVGVKIAGPDLATIERLCIALEGLLREVPGTRSTFADRQSGREYIDIEPDRDAIARHGLTVRDVHDVIEVAIGGMPLSTVIRGRSRFTINLRYGSDLRADVDSLRNLLVSSAASEPSGAPGGAGSGDSMNGGAAGAPTGRANGSFAGSGGGASGGMGAMGGGGSRGGSGAMGSMGSGAGGSRAAGAMASSDPSSAALERWRPRRALVPLGSLARVRIVTGPPMIKDEDGVLVGYVYVDVDTARRDLGGWVRDARQLVQRRLAVPAGYSITWTGQYEFMRQMEERMRYVLPITLALVVILLHMSMRGWRQTALVLMSLPFALAGSIWLLAWRHYNLSTAVWVGLIAVLGVAAETGTVMIVYLDEAMDRKLKLGRALTAEDVNDAIVEGASQRVRPLLMTVATTVLGLLPLLWESGVGADVSARTAAPVVGGLWSCMALTLLVLPAAYAIWRRRQVRRAQVT